MSGDKTDTSVTIFGLGDVNYGLVTGVGRFTTLYCLPGNILVKVIRNLCSIYSCAPGGGERPTFF